MKALFKRSAPSLPPALPPATPFPSLEYRRDIQSSGTISSGGSRHRAFSLSRDYNAGSSPNMVISQPMLQTELRSPPPEHFVYGRKRLQSGGITFDEVLPSLSASPGSAPPVPQLPTASLSLSTPTSCGSPNRVRTPLSIPIPPAALSALEQAYETCTSNPEDVSPSSVLALENTVTTPTRTPRPSVRRRRGTHEVGISTSHIGGLVSPATGSYRDLVSYAPRPQLAGRRAASMGDVRGRNDLANAIHDSSAPNTVPSMATLFPHSRVRSDQTRDAASARLLAAADITVRPRVISTSVLHKQRSPSRRPALARAVQMYAKQPESRQAVAAAAAAVTQTPILLSTAPLVLTPTLQATAPTGTPPLALESAAVSTPPLQPFASHTFPLGKPGLRGPCAYPPTAHSPTSMLSSYHKYARNLASNVPFPQEGTSPRTVLSPPENPQMAAALQVDATRISLDKYDIHQDLTFVLRVQNVVADDVELELVKTVEGCETVYELKIRKKDPDNLRVRNGIIPYTYVPPFASPSSVSSPSSRYSSPLTTPTLEVPYGQHNGSYFPMGAGRSPRRNSLVTKPAASARLSHLVSRTPTAKPKQSTTVDAKTSKGHGLELNLPPSMLYRAFHTAPHSQRASPISPTFKNRLDSATSAYDSDEDDGYDNASVLAHYTPRDTCAAQPESPRVFVGGEITSSEESIHGKSVFNSDDDDIVQERDDEASDREVTFPIVTKSYWSDTDAEAETEGEDGEDEEVIDTGDVTSGDDSPTGPATP